MRVTLYVTEKVSKSVAGELACLFCQLVSDLAFQS